MAKPQSSPTFRTSEALLEMPGNLLRRCHQIAVAIFLDECRAADLTPLQFVALTTLATEGALDKATIGGRAALDRTTVAVVAKNLWERGLVTTRPSEHDRRATLIEITDEGLALLTSVQDQVARTQERIVAPLDAAERAEFVRLLSKIAEENNLLSRAPHRLRRSATA